VIGMMRFQLQAVCRIEFLSMVRHVPIWSDRFPKSRRRSYPRLKGEHQTRVVIIGGGLTGAACAISFASAGVDVVLLEANTVGGGMVAGDAGVLREGFAGSLHAAVAQHGLRTSRAIWDTLRRGSLDFAAALRRYRIRCDLASSDLITFAARNADAGRPIRREYDTRHGADIEGSWMTPAALSRDTALDSSGGIRTHGSTLDPYRACVGLMAAAAVRGARVFEHSSVRRIRARRRDLEIVATGGTVTAEFVVVATAAPIQDLRGLRRHLRREHAYGVVTEPLPAAMRRQVGRRASMLEYADEPGRIVRWLADDRVLIHGGRQPEVPARLEGRTLIQRTGQLMYELSLLYPAISGLQPVQSWAGLDSDTSDGLPFVGPHRNYPRHFFAYGSSRHGAGLAWTAARAALRHFTGEATRADQEMSFSRVL
jgi:glycine/D-amino acid oxidase-like deaminating enzyme